MEEIIQAKMPDSHGFHYLNSNFVCLPSLTKKTAPMQRAKPARQFFDLHCHPIFKTLFREKKKQLSAWKKIELNDTLLGNCFESQSSLDLLFEKGDINLVCIGDHAPEMGSVRQLHLIAIGSAIYGKFLGLTRLIRMALAFVDYRSIHVEEIDNLKEPPPRALGKKKIKILTKMSDYDPKDFDTLHVIFHVEGGHMFYTARNGHTDLGAMIKNFLSHTQNRLLLYVTPTHLTPNAFCNHAYGNKFLVPGPLYPYGKGLFDNGKKLIDVIYGENVLIDIKHMSWVARDEFYAYREEKKWDKPLIASHVGFTGFKVSERFDKIVKQKGLKKSDDVVRVRYIQNDSNLIKGTFFNPNSINLYDDDIVEVLKSRGLIGISLDKRILGVAKRGATESEFISNLEYDIWEHPLSGAAATLFPNIWDPETYMVQQEAGHSYLVIDEEDLIAAQEEADELFPVSVKGRKAEVVKDIEEHLKYFINHLLKVKKVADENAKILVGINPWKHICIGSDFDGLISALHCCMNVTELGAFSNMVESSLQRYADEVGIKLGMPVKDIVENIFFKNGYEFLQNHFK